MVARISVSIERRVLTAQAERFEKALAD